MLMPSYLYSIATYLHGNAVLVAGQQLAYRVGGKVGQQERAGGSVASEGPAADATQG